MTTLRLVRRCLDGGQTSRMFLNLNAGGRRTEPSAVGPELLTGAEVFAAVRSERVLRTQRHVRAVRAGGVHRLPVPRCLRKRSRRKRAAHRR